MSRKNKVITIVLCILLIAIVGVFAWLSYSGRIQLGAQSISQKGKTGLVKFYKKNGIATCDISFGDKTYQGLNIDSENFINDTNCFIKQLDYENNQVKNITLTVFKPLSSASFDFRFTKVGQSLNIPSETKGKKIVFDKLYQKNNKNYVSFLIDNKTYEAEENKSFAQGKWFLGKINLKGKIAHLTNKINGNVNIDYFILQGQSENLYVDNYNPNAAKNISQSPVQTADEKKQEALTKEEIDKITDPTEKAKELKNLALEEVDSNPEEAADLLDEAEAELTKITDESQKQELSQEIGDAKGKVEAEKQKLDQGKEDVVKTTAEAKTVQSKQVAGGGASNSKPLKVFGVTAGGMVGGAAIGAGVGSVVPGIGTAIGGIGGGIIGGLAGLIGGLFGF